jgi:hypothetical protein
MKILAQKIDTATTMASPAPLGPPIHEATYPDLTTAKAAL